MTRATIKYLDEKKRRIIIPKEIAEVEDLHAGDYIEIDIKKILTKKEQTGHTEQN